MNCNKCNGKSVLDCSPCQTQGGFRQVENLVYKTMIEANDVTLAAIENIRDKIKPSYQDLAELTQPQLGLEEIKAKATHTELLGPIEQVHTYVRQNRPSSTLLERFSLKKATVLDTSFKYESEAGHSYYDYNSQSTIDAVFKNGAPLAGDPQ